MKLVEYLEMCLAVAKQVQAEHICVDDIGEALDIAMRHYSSDIVNVATAIVEKRNSRANNRPIIGCLPAYDVHTWGILAREVFVDRIKMEDRLMEY